MAASRQKGTIVPQGAAPSGEGLIVANGQRKKIGAVRSTSAVILASLGVFTAMAGLGLQSWPLGAIGAAMLVLAVALLLTSSFRGADRAFVVGTAHVLEITEAPVSLTHGRCEMHLQIEAPGHPPASVRVRDPRVPVAKWPSPGDILPVRVAVDDIRRVRVLWDEVLTHTQHQQEYADSRYDGLTEEDEPLYDDQRPADAYAVHVPHARDDLESHRDGGVPDQPVTEEPAQEPAEGPPLPQRRRPRPRPRRSPREADEPIPVVQSPAQVLEGEVLAAPARVNVIDFSDAPPPPQSDVSAQGARDGTAQQDLMAVLSHPEEPVDPIAPYGTRPGTSGAVHGLGMTMLVADVGRSVAFYRDLLGFSEIDSGRTNAVLASGDIRIVLRKAEDFSAGNRRLTHLNIEVGDLDSVYRKLLARGIGFSYAPRVVNRGERLELWAAAFRDPDGHAINLTQWRTRS
jgi:catechol 2,3-dioxygenase-like lactoylglutathione lyase family enzyme